MIERENILPMALGMLFAAGVHLAAGGGYVAWGDRGAQREEARRIDRVEDKRVEEKEEERVKPPPPLPEPPPEPPIGQKEPSTMKINWISVDAFEELAARQSKFDQAAVQASVDPVKKAGTPLDPTPPLPRPSRSPAPAVAAAQPTVKSQPARAVVKPTEKPAEPKQPEPMPEAKRGEPKQAPELPKTSATQAAAPMKGEATPPSRIEPQGKDAPTPRVATDDLPAEKPVSAPKVMSKEAPKVALATPQVPSNPSPEPKLPEPVPGSDAKELANRKSPEVKPDEKSDPDDKTLEQPGEEPKPRRVAMLTLSERVRELIGSPQVLPPNRPAPDRETAEAPKPVEKEEADGSRREAKEMPQRDERKPSPPRPLVADTVPRPTAAPKDKREAPPVSRIEGVTLQLGKVVARQGVQVNTVQPRWTIQALLSKPNNPDVEVTFDRSGKVVQARIVRATGYDNLDGPLLSSLYRWTAEGEFLEKSETGRMTVAVHILLRDD